MNFDVVVSGLNVVDLLFKLPEHFVTDSKHEVDTILLQGGAPAGNAASVMAMLGLNTAFLGYRGDNTLSVVAESELQRCRVDTQLMLDNPVHAPAIAVVQINPKNGERTVFYSLANYSALAVSDIDSDSIKNSKLVFVDGYNVDTNIALLEVAQKFGIPSVLDIEAGDKDKLKTMLKLGSHCILPLECAQFLTGLEDAKACLINLATLTNGQLIITDGTNGSWAYDNGNIIHQTVFDTNVVDTTGCGDSYHGAYAYALLKGRSLQDRMKFASAYAAIIARYMGGRSYHPSAEEVDTLIQNT